MGETIPRNNAPEISIYVKGTQPVKTVEILCNSRVLESFEVPPGNDEFSVEFTDKEAFSKKSGVLYYYARVTQKNEQLAWSSPVWFE